MIIDELKRIVQQSRSSDNRAYLLNLLKEALQSYVLYFIYTSKDFKDLVFTGGTCLRRIYGLNRLSVDLDFDFETNTSPIADLADKLETWFHREHQLKDVRVVIRKENIKVKLKGGFDILPDVGKDVLFVSVDLSQINFKEYSVENNLISTPAFSFIVRNFDLPTMFANKISAFLGREFRFGKLQEVSFKGRDVYDLFWLCQRSKQNQYQLKPRFERLFEELKLSNKDEVLQRILEKIKLINDRQLTTQLLPFFPDGRFVESFVSSYKNILLSDIKQVFL